MVYAARVTQRPLIAIAVLAALCVADWAWTVAHLMRGVAEANPLLAWTYEHGGLIGFSVAKLGSLGAALLVLIRFRDQAMTRRLVPIAIAVYGGVLAVHVATEHSY